MGTDLKRAAGGFTLVELMVGLTILATIMLFAAPQLAGFFQAQRRRAAESELTGHLALARVAAISRGVRVTVRPMEGGWNAGWQVFVDENADSVRSADEELLAEHQASTGLLIQGTGVLGTYAMFGPDGLPVQATGAFLSGTLEICQAEGGSVTRLVMSATGRIRREDANDVECGATSDQ